MATELVVGIDFGTTYSGASWAVNAGNRTVRLITDWPIDNSKVTNADKVPTSISYKDGKTHKWGNKIRSEECLRWFKLLIDPDGSRANEAQAALTSASIMYRLNKGVGEVSADYIRKIWEWTKQDIMRKQGDDWETTYKLRVVLTVPAIWSDLAKERTLAIAKAAGLPSGTTLISEPEAAAHAVLKDKRDDDATLKVGDCFVVCDAGGGTVDLISYKVNKLEPLTIEECAVGEGALCGSTYVDAAFEKYIRTIVGEAEYTSIPDQFRRLLANDFEYSVKRNFTGEETEDLSVEFATVQDNVDAGIEDGTIRLKPTLLRTIFDHVINQIMTLVGDQIHQVEEKNLQVKAILLVGGFGASKYLYKRLYDAHRTDGVQVLQCAGAWSAVCRGATMWGLERCKSGGAVGSTIQARLARYSYGVACARKFDSHHHLEKDRRSFPDGVDRACNQMQWLLRKGDRMETGRAISTELDHDLRIKFLTFGTQHFNDTLYYCGDKKPPSRRESNVKELCTVAYGIEARKLRKEDTWKSPVSGETWRTACFKMEIKLRSAELQFRVYYHSERVGYTNAKYRENSKSNESSAGFAEMVSKLRVDSVRNL